MWADFAEIRSWRETSTAADFGEIGPHIWCHPLFLPDIGPQRADKTTFRPAARGLGPRWKYSVRPLGCLASESTASLER